MKRISSLLFGDSKVSGDGARRSVALTFDDGPATGTPYVLDILESAGVRATFFQCGANVERHAAIARSVVEHGHEVGNHTYSHPRLCPRIGWKMNFHSASFVREEFESAQSVIASETGATPTLLRAPYGLPWFGLRRTQRELGLVSVLWTVIGEDWKRSPADIVELVLAKASPGGIICLHDGRDTRSAPDISSTLDALRTLIPRLKDQGYAFETASSILDHPQST